MSTPPHMRVIRIRQVMLRGETTAIFVPLSHSNRAAEIQKQTSERCLKQACLLQKSDSMICYQRLVVPAADLVGSGIRSSRNVYPCSKEITLAADLFIHLMLDFTNSRINSSYPSPFSSKSQIYVIEHKNNT